MKLMFITLFVALLSTVALADNVIWSCSYNDNPSAITISSLDPVHEEYGVHIAINESDLQGKFGAGFDAEGDAGWLQSQSGDFSLIGGEYERIDVSFVNGGVNFQLNDCVAPDCTPNPAFSYWFEYGLCVKQ